MVQTIERKKEQAPGKITTIGLDLAKSVFHVVGPDERGNVVARKRLRQGQV